MKITKTNLKQYVIVLFAMLIAMCLTLVNPINVYATDTGTQAQSVTSDQVLGIISASALSEGKIHYGDGSLDSILNQYLTTRVTQTLMGTLSDGTQVYYVSTGVDQPTALSNIAAAMNARNNSTQSTEDGKQKVAQVGSTITGSGFEVGADVQTGAKILSGFSGLVSMVLGLMVVLISLGMTIFSACDLAYIAFPVFRNKCEDMKQSGSRIGTKTGSNGETKLRFVTDEAQYAVNAAETTESGKNPFVIYFSKRILSYIILAILLFILLTGRITVFTDLGVKLADGIVNLIADQTSTS